MRISTASRQRFLSTLFWLIRSLYITSTSKVFPKTNLTEVRNLSLELLGLHLVLTYRVTDDKTFFGIFHPRGLLVCHNSCHSSLQRVVITSNRRTNQLINDDIWLTTCSKASKVFPVRLIEPVLLRDGLSDILISLPDTSRNLERDDKTSDSLLPSSMNSAYRRIFHIQ